MAMVIRNNKSAVHTLNTLNRNSKALSKSLEQVSSGRRINSAGDDAAAYSISERMQVQIRSLEQDERNTQTGSALLRTAEGAVSRTVDILRTLKEKVISAANDDKTDADRQIIQKELDQNLAQIDDNALVTFNGRYLEDGSNNRQITANANTFTNYQLSKTTTGSTKFVDMLDREDSLLGITMSDTITMSYVKQGKTYRVNVDGTGTIEDAIAKANAMAQAGSSVTTTRKKWTVNGESTYDYSQVIYSNDSNMPASLYRLFLYAPVYSAPDGAESCTEILEPKIRAIKPYFMNYLNDIVGSSPGTKAPLTKLSKKLLAGSTSDANGVATTAVTGIARYVAGSRWGNGYSLYWDHLYDANGNEVYVSQVLNPHWLNGAYLPDAENYAGVGGPRTPVIESEETTTTNGGDLVFEADAKNDNEIGVDGTQEKITTADGQNALTITTAKKGLDGQVAGLTFCVTDSKGNIKRSATEKLNAFDESIRAEDDSEDNQLVIHTGTKANQNVKVYLTDMRSYALGLKSDNGKSISIGTQESANATISALDNALQKALNEQTRIGAYQSRLETTQSNLTIATENVQASESTLRDADMAKSMTEYTTNKVLLQAAQSMLAQANQSGSSVLDLLQ